MNLKELLEGRQIVSVGPPSARASDTKESVPDIILRLDNDVEVTVFPDDEKPGLLF